jgi:hypothetical protein
MIKSRRMRGQRLLSPRHRWEDYIKMNLRQDRVVWTGLMWLRIGTSEGLL